jgi:hypothetical protein
VKELNDLKYTSCVLDGAFSSFLITFLLIKKADKSMCN